MIDIIKILLITFVSVFCSFPFLVCFYLSLFFSAFFSSNWAFYILGEPKASFCFLPLSFFLPPLSSRRRNATDNWLGHLLYSLRFIDTNNEIVPRDLYFFSSIMGGCAFHQVGMLWSKTQFEPWIKIDKVGLVYFGDSCLCYPCLTHQYETRIPV